MEESAPTGAQFMRRWGHFNAGFADIPKVWSIALLQGVGQVIVEMIEYAEIEL